MRLRDVTRSPPALPRIKCFRERGERAKNGRGHGDADHDSGCRPETRTRERTTTPPGAEDTEEDC